MTSDPFSFRAEYMALATLVARLEVVLDEMEAVGLVVEEGSARTAAHTLARYRQLRSDLVELFDGVTKGSGGTSSPSASGAQSCPLEGPVPPATAADIKAWP